MTETIALIGVDWGTTNRRAWAFAGDGRIVGERADGEGLLSVPKGGFPRSFAELIKEWRARDERIPVLMCGMVGSKLGWIEAPYVRLPVDVDEFARELREVPDAGATWIVPGACDEQGAEPDVMRGEECQILGTVLKCEIADAVFLLPGTHSKWAIVEARRLVRFRTYMTGEVFSLLRASGTIAQLIEPGDNDQSAFADGIARSQSEDSSLLHAIFGTRTLALFGRLPRRALASYLSGLLIGAELADALRWSGTQLPIIAVGSAQLIGNYRAAAHHFGVKLDAIESAAVLPSALIAIARGASLLSST
jgi:2-dehydro-3-deoxygalactonokinase